MTEPVTPPQAAPKVDKGHLLPQKTWDQVQEEVKALQAEDPAYNPSLAVRLKTEREAEASG